MIRMMKSPISQSRTKMISVILSEYFRTLADLDHGDPDQTGIYKSLLSHLDLNRGYNISRKEQAQVAQLWVSYSNVHKLHKQKPVSLITEPNLKDWKNCQVYEIRSQNHRKTRTSLCCESLGACQLEPLEPRPRAGGEPPCTVQGPNLQ